MPIALEQPVAAVTPDVAISALLSLFHDYAMQERESVPPRLRHRICLHLKGLVNRGDLPEPLQQTCEELREAWQQVLESQQPRLP